MVVINTHEIVVFNVEASHAASHTDHDVWRVYAGHFDASTLVLDRHSVSPPPLSDRARKSCGTH